MDGSPNLSPTPAADADHFGPADAADLLARTRREARRGFEGLPPLVCLVSAAVVLCVYGLLWLSVRDQHPYVGPRGAVVGWVYGILAVSVVVSVTAYRRAMRGVDGRSRRDDALAWLAVGVPWIAVYVFNGALRADGFGDALVNGVFNAAGPWLVVGTAVAAYAIGRGQRRGIATGFTLVVAGTAAAFFGPAGCWGVLAVVGCAGMLFLAAAQYVQLRRV